MALAATDSTARFELAVYDLGYDIPKLVNCDLSSRLGAIGCIFIFVLVRIMSGPEGSTRPRGLCLTLHFLTTFFGIECRPVLTGLSMEERSSQKGLFGSPGCRVRAEQLGLWVWRR